MAVRVATVGLALVFALTGAVPSAAQDAAAIELELLADPDDPASPTSADEVNERGQVAGLVGSRVARWDPGTEPVLAPDGVGPSILAFDEDGTVLAATSDLTEVAWWNPTTGRLDVVRPGGQVLAGNEAGALVVRGGGATWLRAADGVVTRIVDQESTAARLTASGWVLLLGGPTPDVVHRWSASTGLESTPAGWPAAIADDGTVILTDQYPAVAPEVRRWAVDGTTTPLFSLTAADTVGELRLGPTGALSGTSQTFELRSGTITYRTDGFVWTPGGGVEVVISNPWQSAWQREVAITTPSAREQVALGSWGGAVLWSPGSTRPLDGRGLFPGDLSERGQVAGTSVPLPYGEDAGRTRAFVTVTDEPPTPTPSTAPTTTTTTARPPATATPPTTTAAPRFAG